MHFTTKMKLRALMRSIFKIIFFPILAPLWALGLLYREEKKKQFIEGVEDVIGLSDDGLMLSGQHRLKAIEEANKVADAAHANFDKWTITDKVKVHEMGGVPASANHFIEVANSTNWLIEIIDETGAVRQSQPCFKEETKEGFVLRGSFDIEYPGLITHSRAKYMGRVLGDEKLSPRSDGTFGTHVLACDILKITHILMPEEVIKKPEFPFHVGDYALVDTKAMKGRGQYVRILSINKSYKSVVTRWLMKDGRKGRKQSYNISSLIKKPLPAGYFTTFAESKSVTLKVYNTSGYCQQEIRIAGSVYEANLKARTFLAKVRMVGTYSIGTLRLYNQDNKLIGANPWLEYVRKGQVVDLTFLLTDEMMKKFETKKTSGVLWQGKPIECLDDGHLYNIVMAIHNGEWASGAKVNFAGPMEDALLKEYRSRGLDTPDQIDKFVDRNNLWEESRTRAHH